MGEEEEMFKVFKGSDAVCVHRSYHNLVASSGKVNVLQVKLGSMLSEMASLRVSGALCDVNLEVEGDIIKAHRLVLAATSAYFKSMFTGAFQESSKETIIYRL